MSLMQREFKMNEKTESEKSMYESFIASSDLWDRMSSKLFHEAQERHNGRIRIRSKEDTRATLIAWTLLGWIVYIVTFGKGFDLINGCYTTFGYTIFCPGKGTSFSHGSSYLRYSLLAHEIAHIDDIFLADPDAQDSHISACKRELSTSGSIMSWAGAVAYSLAYILLPLPYVYAKYRARSEYHGYKRSMYARLVIEISGDIYHSLKVVPGVISRSFVKLRTIDYVKEFLSRESTSSDSIEHFFPYFNGWKYGKMATEKESNRLLGKMFIECSDLVLKESSIDSICDIIAYDIIRYKKIEYETNEEFISMTWPSIEIIECMKEEDIN